MVPAVIHFAEAVVDWVWLPMLEPNLFVPGVGPAGRDVTPPDWPIMVVRVDLSVGTILRRIRLSRRL